MPRKILLEKWKRLLKFSLTLLLKKIYGQQMLFFFRGRYDSFQTDLAVFNKFIFEKKPVGIKFSMTRPVLTLVSLIRNWQFVRC